MTTHLFAIFVIAILAYLVGSCRLAGAVERVLRPITSHPNHPALVVGKSFADIAKGYLVVSLAWSGGPECARIAALFVFLGHTYPFFAMYTGRNGMSVLLGALLAFDPFIGACAFAAWVFGVYVFRFASLAALSSAVATPILVVLFAPARVADLMLLFGLAALVFWRQREHLRFMGGRAEQVIDADNEEVRGASGRRLF